MRRPRCDRCGRRLPIGEGVRLYCGHCGLMMRLRAKLAELKQNPEPVLPEGTVVTVLDLLSD